MPETPQDRTAVALDTTVDVGADFAPPVHITPPMDSSQLHPAAELLVSVIEARGIASESDLGSDPDFLLRLRLGQEQEAKTAVARGSFQPRWLFDTKLRVPEQSNASSLTVELVQVDSSQQYASASRPFSMSSVLAHELPNALQVFEKGNVIVGAASVPISSLTRTRSHWIALHDSTRAKTAEVLLVLRAGDSGASSPTFSAISERSKFSALERADSHHSSSSARSSADGATRQGSFPLPSKRGRLAQLSIPALQNPAAQADLPHTMPSSAIDAAQQEHPTSHAAVVNEAVNLGQQHAGDSGPLHQAGNQSSLEHDLAGSHPHDHTGENEEASLPSSFEAGQDKTAAVPAPLGDIAHQTAERNRDDDNDSLDSRQQARRATSKAHHAHVPLPLALLGAGLSATVAFLVGRHGQHYQAVQDGDAVCTIGLCNHQHMQEFMAGQGSQLTREGRLSVGDRLLAR